MVQHGYNQKVLNGLPFFLVLFPEVRSLPFIDVGDSIRHLFPNLLCDSFQEYLILQQSLDIT